MIGRSHIARSPRCHGRFTAALAQGGALPGELSPEASDRLVTDDLARWREVAEASRVLVEQDNVAAFHRQGCHRHRRRLRRSRLGQWAGDRLRVGEGGRHRHRRRPQRRQHDRDGRAHRRRGWHVRAGGAGREGQRGHQGAGRGRRREARPDRRAGQQRRRLGGRRSGGDGRGRLGPADRRQPEKRLPDAQVRIARDGEAGRRRKSPTRHPRRA
jgi:hypothetical protein